MENQLEKMYKNNTISYCLKLQQVEKNEFGEIVMRKNPMYLLPSEIEVDISADDAIKILVNLYKNKK